MLNFRSIMDIEANEWLIALGLTEQEIPDTVIVEGSWWRAQRQEWRLGLLSDVRELNFPDIYWGRWKDTKVAFCMAYGAPRTVEIMHLFGVLGTKLAVQIGTCGGLQTHLNPGDIVVPNVAIGREGVAHMYSTDATRGTTQWLDRAQTQLKSRQHTVYRGTHMTWSSLFTETVNMMEVWHHAGYLSVDMETATTYAVAQHFGMSAVSMLVVWDELTSGRRFLDPLTDEEQTKLDRANASVFDVALELTEMVAEQVNS